MEELESIILDIRQGDEAKRDQLIISNKESICSYSSHICQRPLHWQNDDELSIALTAFNKAIDTFDQNKSKGFSAYAKHLIKNALIDYFRGQKPTPLSLDSETFPGNAHTPAEIAAAWSRYRQEVENRDRAYEIQLLEDSLRLLGLSLEELTRHSPHHQDTRDSLKEAAWIIGAHPELARRFLKEKKLPASELKLVTGLDRRTLHKWKEYLTALVLIRCDAGMDQLMEYIWGRRKEHHEND